MPTTDRKGSTMSTIWVELLGAEVRHYDAGGIRTRCIEAGEGPPVILLHGMGGHAEAYARNVVPLAEHFRVLAVDYLGFGLTDKPAEPPTCERYVEHLVDLMDAAGIDRAHLVGESLGGWIAVWAALMHPDRVRSLVSVCGARFDVETDPESERYTEQGRAELQRVTRQYVDDPTPANVRKRLEWLFHDPSDITDELVAVRWALYQREDAKRVLAGVTDTMLGGHRTGGGEAFITKEELMRIAHPTLVLWTSHNPSTTAATAERAAAYIDGAEFTVMQDCGHWPQWEDPERFNAIVTRFLLAREDSDG